LELLTGHVERQVVGIYNTLNKVEILGHQLLEVLRDEHTPDVEFEGRLAAIVIVIQVERGISGNVKDGLELNLTLSREVRVGNWVVGILGDGLVEAVVHVFSQFLLRAHPDSLDLIDVIPAPFLLSHGLHLRLLLFLLLAFVLNFNIIVLLGVFRLLFFIALRLLNSLAIALGDGDALLLGRLRFLRDFFLDVLGNVKLDRVVDEL